MKAVLDHIGIAVKDLQAALAFYRDALGLEVEAPEEVTSQRVRAHFLPVGQSGDTSGAKLELLESTASDSPIAKYLEKRGPGLHHITLRVDDIAAALAQLKSRGTRLIDESPRPGAEGALVAFIHPSSAHGVLVELKQSKSSLGVARDDPERSRGVASRAQTIARFKVGDLELVSLYDGFLHLDGGALFGLVPKSMWASRLAPDAQNRVRLAIRPLLVRGVRTMLIDAGIGDQSDDRTRKMLGVERDLGLDRALAEAGVRPEEIDIVLATHLHLDHAGGFTMRGADGRLRPRFPRARYIARRGEWEDATHLNDRTRFDYRPDDYRPLAEAGVLELVDDDQTIMPGVRVRRTGGHTPHHQAVLIESKGERAVYPADLMPTAAHVPPGWVAGVDLNPVETMTSKQQLLSELAGSGTLVLFDHDPDMPAATIVLQDGKPQALALRPTHRG
jgi:methylmalonyl-CoA epimerase